MVSIVLYGRPGCHLCEDARSIVLAARERFDFTFEELSIEDDEALLEKYVIDIPVVTIDGDFFCQYEVIPSALEAKLETLTERRLS